MGLPRFPACASRREAEVPAPTDERSGCPFARAAERGLWRAGPLQSYPTRFLAQREPWAARNARLPAPLPSPRPVRRSQFLVGVYLLPGNSLHQVIKSGHGLPQRETVGLVAVEASVPVPVSVYRLA
jgi:hypothetical protein